MAPKVRPSNEPSAQRKRKCKDKYGENAAGKWVRKSAFREIDCDRDNPDSLREFDSFEKAFEFDEARRLDGTGGRHAKPYPKPKDTVPKEQLALEKAVEHMVQNDGNETRVALGNPPIIEPIEISRSPGSMILQCRLQRCLGKAIAFEQMLADVMRQQGRTHSDVKPDAVEVGGVAIQNTRNADRYNIKQNITQRSGDPPIQRPSSSTCSSLSLQRRLSLIHI